MLRKFLLAAIIAINFLPALALAQENKIPEFNPICWREDACQKQRKALNSDADVKDGWLENEDPCNKTGWGKCLPAGKTVTEIAFGGRREFVHLGDFIQTVYKFAIGAAAILAVVMIVVAGAQWAASGGNAETIGSSKKKIVGALVGLFIAYASYFILNTVNPALVNLRLPNVWMLKPQQIIPQFCSQASADNKFASAPASVTDLTGVEEQKSIYTKITDFPLGFSTSSKSAEDIKKQQQLFACGKRFFVKDSGGAICKGNYCGSDKICVDFGDDLKNPYSCEEGLMTGRLVASSPISPQCPLIAGYKYPYIDDDAAGNGITRLCKNKEGVIEADLALNGESAVRVKNRDNISTQSYLVTLNKDVLNKPCFNEGSVVGYGLKLSLNRSCALARNVWLIGKGGRSLAELFIGEEAERKGLAALAGNDLYSKEEIMQGEILLDIDVSSIPTD